MNVSPEVSMNLPSWHDRASLAGRRHQEAILDALAARMERHMMKRGQGTRPPPFGIMMVGCQR
jgi:hypothetical protein